MRSVAIGMQRWNLLEVVVLSERRATEQGSHDAMADAIVQNAEAWHKTKKNQSIAVRAFSNETARQMQEMRVQLLKQLSDKDVDGKRVIVSFDTFYVKIREYSDLTDRPFLEMRSAK